MDKKIVICAIAWSLAVVPSDIAAKEKPGADVVIIKKDGNRVMGELLSVRRDIITAMESGNGVYVDFNEIREIQVRNRAKRREAGKGLLIGFACGAVSGFIIGGGFKSSVHQGLFNAPMFATALFGGVGTIVGLLCGVGAASDKIYKIEGAATNVIEEILFKLDKKARFPSGEKWRKW